MSKLSEIREHLKYLEEMKESVQIFEHSEIHYPHPNSKGYYQTVNIGVAPTEDKFDATSLDSFLIEKVKAPDVKVVRRENSQIYDNTLYFGRIVLESVIGIRRKLTEEIDLIEDEEFGYHEEVMKHNRYRQDQSPIEQMKASITITAFPNELFALDLIESESNKEKLIRGEITPDKYEEETPLKYSTPSYADLSELGRYVQEEISERNGRFTLMNIIFGNGKH